MVAVDEIPSIRHLCIVYPYACGERCAQGPCNTDRSPNYTHTRTLTRSRAHAATYTRILVPTLKAPAILSARQTTHAHARTKHLAVAFKRSPRRVRQATQPGDHPRNGTREAGKKLVLPLIDGRYDA